MVSLFHLDNLCAWRTLNLRVFSKGEAMAIRIQCPGCGKRFSAPDSCLCKTIKCTDCGTKFEAVPIGETPKRKAGEEYRYCPNCGAEFHHHIEECADCHVKLVTTKPTTAELQRAREKHRAQRSQGSEVRDEPTAESGKKNTARNVIVYILVAIILAGVSAAFKACEEESEEELYEEARRVLQHYERNTRQGSYQIKGKSPQRPLDPPVLKPDWIRIAIPKVGTIDMPPTMEVQIGLLRRIKEGIPGTVQGSKPGNIVIQEKGMNEFRRDAMDLYVRVIVTTEIGKPGDFEHLHSKFAMTEGELQEVSENLRREIDLQIDTMLQQQTEAFLQNLRRMTDAEHKEILRQAHKSNLKFLEQLEHISDEDFKKLRQALFKRTEQVYLQTEGNEILDWYPATLENLNGYLAVKQSYRRRKENSLPVFVTNYIFQNNDRNHYLTISYREAEKERWEKYIPDIVASFRITNVR
jgi:DNA-directed RNA polymerase subunit F